MYIYRSWVCAPVGVEPKTIMKWCKLHLFLFKQYFISQTKMDKTAGVSLYNVFSWIFA